MAKIRGTVTGPNGAALANVAVTITPAGGGAPIPLVTNAQGLYETQNIPAGNYTVTLQAPQGMQNPAPAQANPAANATTQKDFALAAVAPPVNGSITGIITDAGGVVVQGVQVTATLVGGAALPVAVSDNLGNYAIANVPPGQYDVTMVAAAAFQPPPAQRVNVAAGPPTVANAQLQPAAVAPPVNGSITGIITDAGGVVVQGVQVTATLVGGAALPVAVSDNLGNYAIANVPPGQYDVTMVAAAAFQPPPAQRVNVAAGPPTVANAQLQPAAVVPPVNGSIAGQITDAAGGVQGVQVTATLVGGAALPVAVSDNLGNYAIANVPPGQYDVTMVAAAAFQPPPAQRVNVAAGPPTILNVPLQAAPAAPVVGSIITGLVTAPNAVGANAGFPNAVVTITPAAAGALPAPGAQPLADTGVPLPSVRTNQLGQYTIANVPAGNYNVSVQAPGQNQNPPVVTITVAGAPTVHNVQLPADQVARFINDFIGPNFEIETPVSMLEAGYAASFFRVANVILAGLTENGAGPDLFGSQRVATAANDLGIQETAPEWQQTIRDAETLKNLVRDLIGAQSLVRLKREAKRQFNLGLENSVTANTRFPVLFRRLVDIATDPTLTMDIADQDRNNPNLDKTKIGQADALLRELKDIVAQIVRSLSKEGQAQTRLDTESWVPVADVAMGMALRLAPVRNTGDADDRNPWAVISVLTNKRRDTDVTPFIVLGRHGGRLLELALTIYQEMNRRNALTSFDTGVLRELFQDSRVKNAAPRTFFTDQLREQAAYIKAYPMPNWG